jgi:CheY-like chemotaxis protein
MARILLIEDEAQIRGNLVRFLQLEGHAVTCAVDGVAGLAAVHAAVPELVICDFMMPRMDGFAVLAALQADDSLRRLPFIMLSASAEPERLEQAVAMGARAYVTKPFRLAEMRALLRQHLPAAF